MANVDEPKGRDPGPATESAAAEKDQEQTDLIDEYGEPFAAEEHEHAQRQPLYRRPVFLIVAAVILLLAGIVGVRYWLYARSHESTDDAFIDGHIIQVSPKASGYITRVYVTDNQTVKAGDLIAEIDPREYEVKLAQAKAALDVGLAQQKQAQTQVTLTRVSTRANVQQAAAGVQHARSEVVGARAGAASERSRTTQAAAGITTAEAGVDQARAQLRSAEAQAARANADVERYQLLYQKDEISRQRLDLAIAAARTANAEVDVARSRAVSAEAQIREASAATSAAGQNAQRAQTQVSGAQAQVNEAIGKLAQANTAPQQVAVSESQVVAAEAKLGELQAAVDQAELELSYTKILAPESGRISRKSVDVGALVQVGQPLMAVVPGDVWVTANFKESQIGRLQPGQSVDLSVDAYPDRVFKGHVDSIQSGTGARFSLIPPENATGNYVKVVQRVPVKIVFEPNQIDAQHLLAPGMSVVPEVRVK